jgi:hypothetical protein
MQPSSTTRQSGAEAMNRLIVRYAISENPAIALAIGKHPKFFVPVVPGRPAVIVEGVSMAAYRFQNISILDVGLPSDAQPEAIASTLAASAIPFILIADEWTTASAAGRTATIGVAAASTDVLVFNAVAQLVLQVNRHGVLASLLNPSLLRIGEAMTPAPVMDADEIVDRLVLRRQHRDSSGNRWDSQLAIGPMAALTGILGGPFEHGGVTVIEGPRLAVVDLGLRISLDAAHLPTPTPVLLMESLHRDFDITERLLLVATGTSHADDQQVNALASLPISLSIDDSGVLDFVTEPIANWAFPLEQRHGGIVMLLDAQCLLADPGAWMKLVRLARISRRCFVVILATDQGDVPIDRPTMRTTDTWLTCTPSGTEGAYDVWIKTSWALPPIGVGTFTHDPLRGSWSASIPGA